jgi:hypothetical protein
MNPWTITLVCALFASLGCNRGGEAEPTPRSSADVPETKGGALEEGPMKPKTPSLPPAPVKPTAQSVTLTGTIVGMKTSGPKTMAGWNGVPSREQYFQFTLDPGQERPPGADETTMLRVPEAHRKAEMVGKKVRVVGTWSKPPPVKTHRVGELPPQAPLARPMRMPVIPNLELIEGLDIDVPSTPQPPRPAKPDRVENWVTEGRSPIFSATRIHLLSSAR